MTRKGNKKTRIEKMLKKYRYVDSYLLNKYSARVYTHADLDKLEKLFEREVDHVWINHRDSEVVFADADTFIWIEVTKLLRGSFRPLKSKKWGGLAHYNAIRRALNAPDLYRDFIKNDIKTWANPSFEYIINEGKGRVFYYSSENKTKEDFVESSKEVLNDPDYIGINWELIPVEEKEFERLLDNERFFKGGLIDDITIDLSEKNLSEKAVYESLKTVHCFELLAGHSYDLDKPYGKVLSYRYGKLKNGELKFFVQRELEKELWKRIGVDVEVDPDLNNIEVEEVVVEE